ncbi:hypothetical protein RJ640_014252 [Escallonia rubra]|uniref:Pentatricopeptide repeat-containing protein n=1 Tax=Escallonia rubra TaxID=112253 RepID=A0AA88QTD9_9ASTE|nr:hypothetical protein RJ640_014252 [Escallonia rubra]
MDFGRLAKTTSLVVRHSFAIFQSLTTKARWTPSLMVSEDGPKPDTVTWNTMICGYCSLQMLSEALQLYEELQHGPTKPNAITYTILIDA